jgi:glycolate oxidase iron-sulfur subunit
MLDGVLKGDLKLNKNINKYLDLCLKCGKCKEFCPSSIDVCKIFEIAKYEYVKNTAFGKFIFFLESKYIMGNILKFCKLLTSPFRINNKKHEQGTTKILYFKGCVNNIFPQTDKFLRKIPNIEIIEKDFDCCGLPFLSSGNIERFEDVKNHNLSLMNGEYDYILTDCASCESTLKSYFDRNDERVNSFISLGELILKQNMKFKFKKPVKVTFHKPCHLQNADFFKPLLNFCENVEYVEMENYDDCCGFAGEFAIKNPKISMVISKKKAQNILNTGADYCITTCPACILGLKQGLFGCKNAPKVLSLAEFLSKSQ